MHPAEADGLQTWYSSAQAPSSLPTLVSWCVLCRQQSAGGTSYYKGTRMRAQRRWRSRLGRLRAAGTARGRASSLGGVATGCTSRPRLHTSWVVPLRVGRWTSCKASLGGSTRQTLSRMRFTRRLATRPGALACWSPTLASKDGHLEGRITRPSHPLPCISLRDVSLLHVHLEHMEAHRSLLSSTSSKMLSPSLQLARLHLVLYV